MSSFAAGGVATEFSCAQFRAALGMFATGVAIVTARSAQGQPVGLTISSFNSVSLDPPLVLWSLGHHSTALGVMREATHYAIHVLTAQQRALAERFAARGIDRWAGVAHQPGLSGVPLLAGAAAVFECRNRSQYVEGDHTIFVGQVLQCIHEPHSSPLLYHAGTFYTEHPLGQGAQAALA